MKRLIVVLALLFSTQLLAATAVERVYVSSIEVTGASRLLPAEAVSLISTYEEREVTFAELMTLRQELTRLLIAEGYVNSGVIVPEQEISDGTVELEVVAGSVTDVQISGNRALSDRFIESIVDRHVHEALNVEALNDSLVSLERHRIINFVNARLVPNGSAGESTLLLAVHEAPRRAIVMSGDNYRSPGVGEHTARFTFVDESLTRAGDALSFTIEGGEGSEDYHASYERPIGPFATSIGGYIGTRQLDVVEDDFEDLDIETDIDSWGVSLTQPLITSPTSFLSAFLGFEHDDSKSELLGERFSFSPGEQNGKSKTSSLFFGAEYARRFGQQRFALRGTVRQGLDVLDATENSGTLPDSNFRTLLLQGQYLLAMSWLNEAELSVRVTAQLTGDALFAQQKLPVGGRYSVRGYRENQFVRDNGVAASAELRIPFPGYEDKLSLVPFFDYGSAWDELSQLPSSDEDDISSVGLGLTWTPLPGLFGELFYAHGIQDVDNPTSSSQERGFHYQLRYEHRF